MKRGAESSRTARSHPAACPSCRSARTNKGEVYFLTTTVTGQGIYRFSQR